MRRFAVRLAPLPILIQGFAGAGIFLGDGESLFDACLECCGA